MGNCTVNTQKIFGGKQFEKGKRRKHFMMQRAISKVPFRLACNIGLRAVAQHSVAFSWQRAAFSTEKSSYLSRLKDAIKYDFLT